MKMHLLLNELMLLGHPAANWIICAAAIFLVLQACVRSWIKKTTQVNFESYFERYSKLSLNRTQLLAFLVGLDACLEQQRKIILDSMAWIIGKDLRCFIQEGVYTQNRVLIMQKFFNDPDEYKYRDYLSLCLIDVLSQTLAQDDFDWEKTKAYFEKVSSLEYEKLKIIFDFCSLLNGALMNRRSAELNDILRVSADMYNLKVYESHAIRWNSESNDICSLEQANALIAELVPQGEEYEFFVLKTNECITDQDKQLSLAETFSKRFEPVKDQRS